MIIPNHTDSYSVNEGPLEIAGLNSLNKGENSGPERSEQPVSGRARMGSRSSDCVVWAIQHLPSLGSPARLPRSVAQERKGNRGLGSANELGSANGLLSPLVWAPRPPFHPGVSPTTPTVSQWAPSTYAVTSGYTCVHFLGAGFLDLSSISHQFRRASTFFKTSKAHKHQGELCDSGVKSLGGSGWSTEPK